MVFADLERLDLLRHIKSCAGSLNFRLRKPTDGSLSKLPSNHAFGLAIDLNADDHSLGKSVAPWLQSLKLSVSSGELIPGPDALRG